MQLQKLIAVLFLCSAVVGANVETGAQVLPVVVLEARLMPVGVEQQAAVYDGNDTIYLILSGVSGIQPYIISSHRLERPIDMDKATQFQTIGHGSAVWGRARAHEGEGTIYYLEGGSEPSKIWKFTLKSTPKPTSGGAPTSFEVNQLGQLAELHPSQGGSIVSDETDYVYIVGGTTINSRTPSDKLYRISMDTDTIDEVVRIPTPAGNAKAVYDKGGRAIYIFDGSGAGSVTKYDIRDKQWTFTVFSPSPGQLSAAAAGLKQVVWAAGKARSPFGLLFPARGWIVHKWSPETPDELTAVELKFQDGSAFPEEDYAALYVENMDRVYILGTGASDATAYIDLSQSHSRAEGSSSVALVSFTTGLMLLLACTLSQRWQIGFSSFD